MSKNGWIGIDLDGTLAHYDGWVSVEHVGEPIIPMLEFVKKLIADGNEVRIFTARVYRRIEAMGMGCDDSHSAQILKAWKEVFKVEKVIHEWLAKHGLPKLAITCVKDFGMICLYDDRCVQVEMNTGRFIGATDALRQPTH